MHYRLLLLLGFIIFLLPFLGFPFSWNQWLQIIIGFAIMFIAFVDYIHSHEGRGDEAYKDSEPEEPRRGVLLADIPAETESKEQV